MVPVTGAGGAIALLAAQAGAAVVVNDIGASLKGTRENAGAADTAVKGPLH